MAPGKPVQDKIDRSGQHMERRFPKKGSSAIFAEQVLCIPRCFPGLWIRISLFPRHISNNPPSQHRAPARPLALRRVRNGIPFRHMGERKLLPMLPAVGRPPDIRLLRRPDGHEAHLIVQERGIHGQGMALVPVRPGGSHLLPGLSAVPGAKEDGGFLPYYPLPCENQEAVLAVFREIHEYPSASYIFFRHHGVPEVSFSWS